MRISVALTICAADARRRHSSGLSCPVSIFCDGTDASRARSLLTSCSRLISSENTATVSDISRMLKIMAKELNVPVICLSQLNRAAVGRSDKRPMLNDLRDSGAIEQDADVVIGLHREGYYDQESSDPYLAEAIVLKNRKGQTGTVYLQWLPEFTSFGNRSAKTDDDY